jgi:hypothetical protein
VYRQRWPGSRRSDFGNLADTARPTGAIGFARCPSLGTVNLSGVFTIGERLAAVTSIIELPGLVGAEASGLAIS